MAEVTTQFDADSAVTPVTHMDGAPPAPVAASLAYCHAVTRERARNFYYGLKLTPEPRRTALYTTYAFMRACDDLVDETPDRDVDTPPDDLTAAQARSRTQSDRGVPRHDDVDVLDGGALPDEPAERSVWPAFRYVAKRGFRLKPEHLHAMLDGQRCDIENTLLRHVRCRSTTTATRWRVSWGWCASTSGVTAAATKARKLAEYQGIAFQLTNIIRDVLEDAQRGRFYLPADEFDRFGYDPSRILAREADDGFDRFMRFQIDRALDYYNKSAALDDMLDPACRATNWAMVQIYRGLLEKIAADPRQVLHQRVRLSRARKMTIAMRAGLRRSTNR